MVAYVVPLSGKLGRNCTAQAYYEDWERSHITTCASNFSGD